VERDRLQEHLKQINKAGEATGLKINILIQKTKTMVFGQEAIKEELLIGNTRIEHVMEFVYLGSLLTWDNDCNKEIKRRIARVTGAMAGFKTVFNSSISAQIPNSAL